MKDVNGLVYDKAHHDTAMKVNMLASSRPQVGTNVIVMPRL